MKFQPFCDIKNAGHIKPDYAYGRLTNHDLVVIII